MNGCAQVRTPLTHTPSCALLLITDNRYYTGAQNYKQPNLAETDNDNDVFEGFRIFYVFILSEPTRMWTGNPDSSKFPVVA